MKPKGLHNKDDFIDSARRAFRRVDRQLRAEHARNGLPLILGDKGKVRLKYPTVSQKGCLKPNSYEMIIWWSTEDGAYVVDVPELPGCMAHGSTRQSAIKSAEDAVLFWIKTAKEDGLEIPQPRGRLMIA